MSKSTDFIKDLKREASLEIQTLTADSKKVKEGLSTGSILLNEALSGNPLIGFARGRIIEVYGPEQSGKTTLTLHCIAEAQKLGWPVVFVDAEHALDPVYAESIGVNMESMGVHQPSSGEEALAVVEAVIKKGCPLVVVDSVAALVPKAELEGEMGDAHMGLKARLMGLALRKLTGLVSKHNATIIFINQIRMKIGVTFGNPETTPGGSALKFAASYRLVVRSPRGGAKKEKSLTTGTVETGIESSIKIVKNKLYPPFRTATIPIVYGEGYDKIAELIDWLWLHEKCGLPKDSKLKTPQLKLKNKWYKKKELPTLLKDPNMFNEAMKYVNNS